MDLPTVPEFSRTATLARIDLFLAEQAPPTPCVVIDLETVRERHRVLCGAFPEALIYYAVKANPPPEVIAALAERGAGFDLASAGEIDRCCGLGIAPERFCFGNTIKREQDIARAHALGMDLYAFDSLAEVEKLARSAPGARVFCRLSVHGKGAEWPLTRKFGCALHLAPELLLRARTLGLRPIGVSFHVGSQQTDPRRWTEAIASAAGVFRACHRHGLGLELLNVGGGLPGHYVAPVPPLACYAETIACAVAHCFGAAKPRLMIEPGRYMVADAGVLRAQALLVARRGGAFSRRWVYVDAGRYNGLAETQGERIHYPIRTARDGGVCEPVVLAGPTCDSTDIIYERTHCALPVELEIGDMVDFLTAGAYTASYASVEFNGYAPVATYCVG